MGNRFSPLMAKKSEEHLLTIAQERHRYEFDAYIAAIEELERRNLATPEILQQKKDNIEAFHTEQKQTTSNPRESWSKGAALFKITKEYVYTPLFIYANVSIWLLMVVAGVNVFEPTAQSLLEWGGNLSSVTLNGQPWRLLTSTFLHGGIIHLLLNMYALIQVGALLETHFGKHRYAIVYFVTGIFASIASTAFSVNVVSVGASGAIFGLYGLLLALLITKSLQINADERKALISSTIFFIGYNVVYGFTNAGIDNAAHIGGLLSGFIVGFLYYPFIHKQMKSPALSILLVVAAITAAWAAPLLITNSYVQFGSVIDKFSKNERKALWMYGMEELPEPGSRDAAIFRSRLKRRGIDLWEENIALLNTLENMPTDLKVRVDLLKEYCQLRIESCEALQAMTESGTAEQMNRWEEINKEIDSATKRLDALNGN